jgi:exodeoxyribonuclease V alpha subunit
MLHAIVVISGGAGTGKTHTLARLAKTFEAANLKVALCSPTGKAAKRIEESLRSQGLTLEAKTVHRLLEYNGHEFQRRSLSIPSNTETGDAPSDAFDVVIVDEVSMVDVPLMAELLRRIDLGTTRLILVGDHNQLPPVGAGNVLRDCIKHKLVPTFVLDEVVRQAGVLKSNSMAILSQRVMPTALGDPGLPARFGTESNSGSAWSRPCHRCSNHHADAYWSSRYQGHQWNDAVLTPR